MLIFILDCTAILGTLLTDMNQVGMKKLTQIINVTKHIETANHFICHCTTARDD